MVTEMPAVSPTSRYTITETCVLLGIHRNSLRNIRKPVELNVVHELVLPGDSTSEARFLDSGKGRYRVVIFYCKPLSPHERLDCIATRYRESLVMDESTSFPDVVQNSHAMPMGGFQRYDWKSSG